MSSPKAAHYNAALNAALTAGNWAATAPGTAPRGAQLEWGELVRKWGKHTGGNVQLVHHLRDISLAYLSTSGHSISSSGFLALPNNDASQSIESSPSATTSADSGSQTTSSFVHIPHPHLHRRHRNQGSVDESVAESGNTVKPHAEGTHRAAYLSEGDLDGDDYEDQRAWAIDRVWWMGVASHNAEEVQEGVRALESSIDSGKLSPADVQSAKLILAYHQHALGNHNAALRVYETVDWSTESRVGVVEGDAAVVERIRARCLQGISYELSSPPNAPLAIQSYLSTIPLLQSSQSFTLPIPSYLGKSPAKVASFEAHREVFRFISTALARAAVLSSHESGQEARQQGLQILRTFHALSSNWPSGFRPVQRQKLLILYLRALHSSPFTSGPLLYASPAPTVPPAQLWHSEVVHALTQGKNLLNHTTSFPRAGAVNHPVLLFATLSTHLYSLSPHSSLSETTLDLLWWSMTLTFQSQSILRNLLRVMVDRKDWVDAKRIFGLYVDLALKARQTMSPEVNLQLQKRPSDEDPHLKPTRRETTSGAVPSPRPAADSPTPPHGAEADDDYDFVRTLLMGARLLSEHTNEPEEAWRYVTLAGDVVSVSQTLGQKSKARKVLEGRVEEAKGVVRIVMSRTTDPLQRATFQSQALNHLLSSTILLPTSPSAFYHLAHAYAAARQVPEATEAVRRALELEGDEEAELGEHDEKERPVGVEGWLLLGVLLTAQGEWNAARKALEAGINIWEDADALPLSVETVPSIAPLLQPSGLPPTLPTLPLCPPTPDTKLSQVIRLRTTLNGVVEKMRGCEEAMVKQQELFAFFSGRCGLMSERKRSSTVGAGASAELTGFREGGLDGSYISVRDDLPQIHTPGQQSSAGSVQGPTLAQPIPRTSSPPAGDALDVPQPRSISLRGRDRAGSLRRGLGKHLNVSRASAVAGGEAEGSDADVSTRLRSPSTAPSIAPTAIHSTYRSSRTPAPPPPSQPSSAPDLHTKEEKRILSDLWLSSAATFRRWGKTEQCLVAVMEAETLDPGNPDVWVQLGLYHIATSPKEGEPAYEGKKRQQEVVWKKAEAAFVKALLMKPDYPQAIIGLSKLYLASPFTPPPRPTPPLPSPAQSQNEKAAAPELVPSLQGPDLAESLLNQLTQAHGWDDPMAWFLLGKVAERQGRGDRARECWEFALGLEKGRGITGWDVAKEWL
ncbi:hypothetical protein B9479_002512 [Cryptococcus floricola]|uniref:TPR-like protein n=1 Tax=Cryptococcus floricola TaxID=2591691 RepID=A0A5D3B0U2_9TREE|nr:hypothetical protein B9479_002512 [Cryptococcus floricola]